MEFLPSLWGTHEVAKITPLIVRNRLITSIIDAPPHWHTGLQALGFIRGSESWLRLGAMSPSEYEQVSPDIRVTEFDTDLILQAEQEKPADESVPFDVQNALLELWDKQPASVLVALSMEHEAHYLRSQAWSFIETALTGALTPQTETLFGLSFTKMNKAGKMTPEAIEFAVKIGWKGGKGSTSNSKGEVTHLKGESVRWSNPGGEARHGRLARKMRSGELGCWVFQDEASWVAGSSVHLPVWVLRERLMEFNPVASTLQPSELKIAPTDFAVSQTELPEDDLVDAYSLLCLGEVLKEHRFFPETGWEVSIDAKGELTIQERESLKARLSKIERSLLRITGIHYGDGLIEVVAAGGEGSLKLALAVRSGGVALLGPTISGTAIDLGVMVSIREVAERLEQSRARREKELRRTSGDLAALAGVQHASLPTSLIQAYLEPFFAEIISHNPHRLADDLLFSGLAILANDSDVFRAVTRTREIKRVKPLHLLECDLSPEFGMGRVVITAHQHDVEYYDVNELTTKLTLDDLGVSAFDSVPRKVLDLFEIQAHQAGGVRVDLSNELALPATAIDGQLGIKWVVGLNQAMQSYVKVLNMIKSSADAAGLTLISESAALAHRHSLIGRIRASVDTLAQLPRSNVAEFVHSELLRLGSADRTLMRDFLSTDAVTRVTDEMYKPRSQGVCILISRTAEGLKLQPTAIPLRDQAVTQSRSAEIDGAVESIAKQKGWRGETFGIDALPLVDRPLYEFLSGVDSALDKTEQIRSGVARVQPYTASMAREFTLYQLMLHAEYMTPSQKHQLICKDVLWPRKSYDELRDSGLPLQAAFAVNTLWKGLPSRPKSTDRNHTSVYLEVIHSARSAVESAVHQIRDGAGGAHSQKRTLLFLQTLAKSIGSRLEGVLGLHNVYSHRDQMIKGFGGLRWSDFNVLANNVFWRKANSLAWADVIQAHVDLKGGASTRTVVRGWDDVISTFGFSRVEFGNQAQQRKARPLQESIRGALMDLARNLQWDPLMLSLGGHLGLDISVPAESSGGRSQEVDDDSPFDVRVIYVGDPGPRSLVYEYFRAVANYFGNLQKAGGELTVGSSLVEPHRPLRWPQAHLLRDSRLGFSELASEVIKGATGISSAEAFASVLEHWYHFKVNQNTLGSSADGRQIVSEATTLFPQIDAWITGLTQAVRKLPHPTLYDEELPLVNEIGRTYMPASVADLQHLAKERLAALFASYTPEVRSAPHAAQVAKYDALNHVVQLSNRCPEPEVFYEQAWHACHTMLLTNRERSGMAQIFSPTSPATSRLVKAMQEYGLPRDAVSRVLRDPREAQALAFGLWAVGKFVFHDSDCFQRTKSFVDGAVEVGSLFGPGDAELLFTRFMEGELALARQSASLGKAAGDVKMVVGDDPMAWDDDNTIYWTVDQQPEGPDMTVDEKVLKGMGL